MMGRYGMIWVTYRGRPDFADRLENSMREVDPKSTSRALAFDLWMKAPMPMVTLMKTLDVTPLVRLSRKRGYKCPAAGSGGAQRSPRRRNRRSGNRGTPDTPSKTERRRGPGSTWRWHSSDCPTHRRSRDSSRPSAWSTGSSSARRGRSGFLLW